jgi:hypothetical protein
MQRTVKMALAPYFSANTVSSARPAVFVAMATTSGRSAFSISSASAYAAVPG